MKRERIPLAWAVLIFCFLCVGAEAQQGKIAGKVIDASTGEPLVGTNVMIKGTTLGTATNKDGEYFISRVPSDKYRAVASMIGYKTATKLVEVSADEISTINFQLCETAIEMGGVVVTATKTERILADVPVEMSVITETQIRQSNAQTTSDLLKYIPGIDVHDHSNQPGNLDWKAKSHGLGFNNGYGLILVNGQRVKGGGMGEYGYGLNHVLPGMIEKVEVVKGPGSVLYGSDAVVGVVNIITKSAPPKRVFSSFAGYGTNTTFQEGLTYGDKLGKFGYLFGANAEKSMASKYGGDDEYEARYASAQFTYGWTEGKRMNLGINWNKKDWSTNEEEGIRISPEFKFGFGDGSKLVLKGYWYNWDFHSFSPGYTEKEGYMRYQQVESQYSRLLFGHIITLGGELLQELIDYQLVKDKTIKTYSLFLQDDWIILNNLNLVSGIRFDSHSYFGKEVNPRVSGLLKLTPDTRLRASVGRSFKSPTIRQMYYTEPYKHSNYYVVSNPDLKAEHGMGYSLGVEQIFGDRLFGNISVFRNDIKDMVASYETNELIDSLPVKRYENVDEAYTQGVGSAIKIQLLEGIVNSFSYTFLDTKDKNTEKELTYCPKHTVGWRLNYDNKRYGFGINWGLKYVSSAYKDRDNTKERDEYFVAEANIFKQLTEYSRISLAVNNLFETDYGDPERADRYPGRTFMGKVSVSF